METENFKIRYATTEDSELIVTYIRELATFEGKLSDVSIMKGLLEKNAFNNDGVSIILSEYLGFPVGFVLFHEKFSTFLGKKGIGLMDLYIIPEMRGHGFGTKLLRFLANLTIAKGYGRLELWVHDWNESTKQFYLKHGTKIVSNIRIYRFSDDNLINFAKKKQVQM